MTLNQLRKGRRCVHSKVTQETALKQAHAAGFEPLSSYPGNLGGRWKVKCSAPDCGKEYSITLAQIQRGRRCQCHRTMRQSAEEELRAAGYEPEAPFPGNTRKPWPSVCKTCGQKRRPNLDTIRAGKRCLHQTPEEKTMGGGWR
ncbi:hypothetical protein [Streptomyces aureocirculatus]|uniref:hypothetical protein n=1 Tax=Streptomyces aureocirculatus TaxID=67275 RepID=UPI00133182C0|nr:hypothetical protein [Streptomyces aureocirculatus]